MYVDILVWIKFIQFNLYKYVNILVWIKLSNLTCQGISLYDYDSWNHLRIIIYIACTNIVKGVSPSFYITGYALCLDI